MLLLSLHLSYGNSLDIIPKILITRERAQTDISFNSLRVVVSVMVLEDTCVANLEMQSQQEQMVVMVAGHRSPSPPAGGVSGPLQTSGMGDAS